jgi:hypothetical protein
VPATVKQQQGKQVYAFLKVNDYIVLDIIKANKWQRPIYFSVTVTDDNYVGLADHLVLQGMAMKLVPYKTTDPNNQTNLSINQDITRKCFFDSPQSASKTPQYGFLFRGLNTKNIFFDETQKRMIETFRHLFIRLAASYSEDSTKYKNVNETLLMLEKKISKDVVEMDYRLKYDVAMLFQKAGNTSKFNEYADEVEKAANDDIKNKRNINSQSYFNPYRILLDIYEAKGNYQAALNLLDVMSKSNPNDPAIFQKRQVIQQKMSGTYGNKDSINSNDDKEYNNQP